LNSLVVSCEHAAISQNWGQEPHFESKRLLTFEHGFRAAAPTFSKLADELWSSQRTEVTSNKKVKNLKLILLIQNG
jgi:hypothetical protein